MTEKLYYQDAYIKEFTATVISCEKTEKGYDTVLTRTAFFPEEGGQYADGGKINGITVLDVKERGGIIHHYLDAPINVGSSAFCTIDFDERYEKMQCHTGEHILSGIIHKLHGLDNVGFHLGKEDVTMDVSAPLTREQLDEIERLANEVIYTNTDVETLFPCSDELSSMQYRSKLDITENVRIVKIGEYDSCACCAPHVKKTGEIGLIKILDFAKLRGGVRLFITAGRRAMRTFSEYFTNAQTISSILSVPKSEIASGVEKLRFDFEDLRRVYSEYRIKIMKAEAEKLLPSKENKIIFFDDATIPEMIEFANVATPKASKLLVLLSGKEGDYKYVISSEKINLREISGDINKSLLGRGGGRPNMIQGSISAGRAEIEKYFNP